MIKAVFPPSRDKGCFFSIITRQRLFFPHHHETKAVFPPIRRQRLFFPHHNTKAIFSPSSGDKGCFPPIRRQRLFFPYHNTKAIFSPSSRDKGCFPPSRDKGCFPHHETKAVFPPSSQDKGCFPPIRRQRLFFPYHNTKAIFSPSSGDKGCFPHHQETKAVPPIRRQRLFPPSGDKGRFPPSSQDKGPQGQAHLHLSSHRTWRIRLAAVWPLPRGHHHLVCCNTHTEETMGTNTEQLKLHPPTDVTLLPVLGCPRICSWCKLKKEKEKSFTVARVKASKMMMMTKTCRVWRLAQAAAAWSLHSIRRNLL